MKTRKKLLATALSIYTGVASLNAARVYLDAPSVGTTVGVVTFTPISGIWTEKKIHGPATNAFGGTAQHSAEQMGVQAATMSISGLEPLATYTGFRIYYIGKAETNDTNNWDFDYSYTGGAGSVLDEISGTIVNTLNAGIGEPASTTGDIRYFVNVPDFTTDATGQIDIEFSRPRLNRNGHVTSDRFVIDGVGFESIPVPKS